MSDEADARRTAAKIARYIGCSGTHEHDGKILPCRSHEELLAISKDAEPSTKSAQPKRKRKRKVSSQRFDRWDKLREKPIASLVSGVPGITSGSPDSEITDSGPTGSTGTAVGGGVMGGIVDGSPGVASLTGSGVLSAKSGIPDRLPDSRRPVTVPTVRLRPSTKGEPRDADGDGWIDEGGANPRYIGEPSKDEEKPAESAGAPEEDKEPSSVGDRPAPEKNTATGPKPKEFSANTVGGMGGRPIKEMVGTIADPRPAAAPAAG